MWSQCDTKMKPVRSQRIIFEASANLRKPAEPAKPAMQLKTKPSKAVLLLGRLWSQSKACEADAKLDKSSVRPAKPVRNHYEASWGTSSTSVRSRCGVSINRRLIEMRINDAVYQRCRIARCIEYQVSHFQRQWWLQRIMRSQEGHLQGRFPETAQSPTETQSRAFK